MAGEVEDLLAAHRMLTGPASESERFTQHWNVVHASSAASQVQLLVRDDGTPIRCHRDGRRARSPSKSSTLAYLREPGAAALPGPARGLGADPSEVTK